jgi:hypothetical protein
MRRNEKLDLVKKEEGLRLPRRAVKTHRERLIIPEWAPGIHNI